MAAYYNEFDRAKAAWLRHLIEEGAIARGVVDERPIQAVQPEDLAGFVQCHFFAGIGLWSLCLRRAGWPDDRPVWTGSEPCGPWSKAGLRKGFEDPRHLWPFRFLLVQKRRPDVMFGEQSDEADAWLDIVQSDLEGLGYAFGAAVIPAAGFQGWHERHRIGFVADANNAEWWSDRAPWNDGHWPKTGRVKGHGHTGDGGLNFGLGHARRDRSPEDDGDDGQVRRVQEGQCQPEQCPPVLGGPSLVGGLDDAASRGRRVGFGGVSFLLQPDRSGDADWVFGRDGLWRPIEPGACPLAPQDPTRMGRLRGYGDAIDVEAFTNLIGAYMDEAPQHTRAA